MYVDSLNKPFYFSRFAEFPYWQEELNLYVQSSRIQLMFSDNKEPRAPGISTWPNQWIIYRVWYHINSISHDNGILKINCN